MSAYFSLPAAGLLFFLSAYFFFLFEHAVAPVLGIKQVDYITAMVATIGLWLVVAPAVGAIVRAVRRDNERKSTH